MEANDKTTSQPDSESSIEKHSTKPMTASSNAEHSSSCSSSSNVCPKVALSDTKLTGTSGRMSARSFAVPMSLKNLKADLMASSMSKSSPISSSNTNSDSNPDSVIKNRTTPEGRNANHTQSPPWRAPPRMDEEFQSSQFSKTQPSSEQHEHEQDEEAEELRRTSSGPLHRPQKQQRSISPHTRSKSSSKNEHEQLYSAENDSSLTFSQNKFPPLWTEGFARGVTKSVKRTVDGIISRGNLIHAPKRQFWSSLSPEDILRPPSHRISSEEEEEEEDYVLGSGSFSKVTKVYLKGKEGNHSNALFALKRLKGDLLPSKLTENSCKNGSVIAFTKAATELAREAFLLSRFDHPHIINILGWTDGGVTSFSKHRRHDAYFLVLELLQEETLEDRIEGWNRDDEYFQSNSCTEDKREAHFYRRKIEQLTICRQVASALAYIHSKNVVYRDLKPQNIGFASGDIGNEVYDYEGNVVVKLMDFGLARELPSGGVIRSYPTCREHRSRTLLFDMTGTVGTIRYMAPEVCMNKPYGLECDIYSWSIVAHEILSQTKPFDDMTPEMYQSLVCQRGVRPPTQNMPSEHIVLLTQAWRTDPSNRLPFSRIKRQLDLFLQQEKLIWEAQELLSDMPEKSESPIFLSKSFSEENFGFGDSSYQRGARRVNKRSWYRENNADSLLDGDPGKNPVFPKEYHREHETPIEYGHTQDYHYRHNKMQRNSPIYEQSPPMQHHYEATSMSPTRRRPEPVTPDRHYNQQKPRHQLTHEMTPYNYYNSDHNISSYHDYQNLNECDNYHHYASHNDSASRHREISPRNDHGHWDDAYY